MTHGPAHEAPLNPARAGTVYLVGGGPGDPGLMTVRGAELVATADVVLYDRLIPAAALTGARAGALLEYAGKGPRGDSKLQPEIESRMVELAREGKSVVRLKGGDPFVFGRGGEEAATLAAAGIPFEIVPGVTAGVAAAAYAGIPVTHREHAAAVAFVTGQENPEKDDESVDWDALARFPGTLVFYMGVRNLPRIAERLIAAGRRRDEPASVIAAGTTPSQRTVTAPLAELPAAVADARIEPPALTVIGDVTAERERIEWFERRPLFGRSIAVTRGRGQAGRLAARLAALGASVVEVPTIESHPRSDEGVREAIANLGSFQLVCFTSANGVAALFQSLTAAGGDARAFAGARVAAVGGATAEALRAHGINPDFVPSRQTAEGLLETLQADAPGGGLQLDGADVLLAVASNARPVLRKGLEALGAHVNETHVYDTKHEPLTDEQVEALLGADAVTFASGSAVRALASSLDDAGRLSGRTLVSIGPTTSASLRELGLEPAAEAVASDIDGLVDAVIAAIAH